MKHRIYIGWSADEMAAFNVARKSLIAKSGAADVMRIGLAMLHDAYNRPTTRQPNGQLFDVLSGAPMSTEHAIARFFVPYLEGYAGLALFTDGDVLFRRGVHELFLQAQADPSKAVWVVPHGPLDGTAEKKDGHVQQPYFRKNWSSVMLFNCGHPANRQLDPKILNTWPGRDLHAFRWLQDHEIGHLHPRWNYLVNISPDPGGDVAVAHFTLGLPTVPGHEHDPFADEWFDAYAAAGYHRPQVMELI